MVATQRVLRGEVRGSRFDPPRFEPALEARRALPCVLRFALRAGDVESAAAAARGARASPHFAHALEWLLFTALEASVAAERRRREGGLLGGERGSPSDPGGVAFGGRTELGVALELVSLFPERADVVASVARKSDAATWPALFAEAGDPAALQAAALTRGRLRVAARYLVVVDALLGAERGAEAGAALLRAALDARRYDVVGELARFLARKKSGAGRNGEEFQENQKKGVSDPGSAEPDGERRVGGGFFSFSFGEGGFLRWIVPSGGASAATGTGTGTREDGSASWRGSRVASFPAAVEAALDAHARRLAADADAGALAALASETSFDAAAFLKRERMGLLVRKAAAGRASRTSPSSLGFFDDFPRAARLVAESLRRYRPSVAGATASASAWGGAGALLRACADAGLDDWVLVLATLLARGDALEAAFSRAGGGEEAAARVLAAWNRAAATCAARFADAGDAASAERVDAFRRRVAAEAKTKSEATRRREARVERWGEG